MSRLISLIVLITIFLSAILSPATTTAQTSDAELLPRFGTGWATLFRSESDYNFQTAMTPDNHYVVGMSISHAAILYVWDIHDLGSERIQPEAMRFDLSEYSSRDSGIRNLNMVIMNNNLVAVRVDDYLLQISIPEFEILDTLDLPETQSSFGRLYHHANQILSMDEYLHQAVIWDVETGEHIIHNLVDKLVYARRWAEGWYFASYRDEDKHTTVQFCNDWLTQCTASIMLDGSIAMILDETIVVGDTQALDNMPTYPAQYYTLENFETGLVEVDAPFSFLPDNDHIPVSISADGKFLSVLTPDPDADPQPFVPERYWTIWDVASEKPVHRRSLRSAYWFGDHFFADELSLYSTESSTRLDELSKTILENLNFHHEVDGIQQISQDGTRMLYNTGGAAVVFTIEYQDITGLKRVTETQWSHSPENLNNIQLSTTGDYLVAREGHQLKRWQVGEDEPLALDLNEYFIPESEDDDFALLVRPEDAFVQVGHHLLRIDLAEFAVVETYTVESVTDYQNPFTYLLPTDEILIAHGDYIAALFTEDLLVWRADGTTFQTKITGRVLLSTPTSWIVFQGYRDPELDQSTFYRCDFELMDCQGYDLENRPISVFYGDNQFATGDRFVQMYGDMFEASSWQINDGTQSAERTEDWLNFPDDDYEYTTVGFYEDYALVLAPNPYPDYNDPPRHYQIWSMATRELVTHRTFIGSWVGYGDYLLFSSDRLLTIFNLTDGRYTRWQSTSDILDLQISDNGQTLLVISAESIEILALSD